MHAGFIGEGMLTAVCPGLVFSSPNALQIHEGSKLPTPAAASFTS